MSDNSHHGSSPLVPGLIGGLVGAALIDAARRQDAAELRCEMAKLAAIERERLAEEQQRVALVRAESQRTESERVFHHAVLWLDRCNNDQRLDYLIQRHGPELADRVAARLLDEAQERPAIAPLFEAARSARQQWEQTRETRHACDALLAQLRSRRWRGSGIWLWGGVAGVPVLLVFYTAFGTAAIAGYVVALVALAVVITLVVHLQGTPADLAGAFPRCPLPGPMRDSRARLESALAAADMELSTATIEVALAREAVAQAFASQRPALVEEAIRHVGAVHPRIDELQAVYPPRARCILAAISAAGLRARLAPHLPAALDRGLASRL